MGFRWKFRITKCPNKLYWQLLKNLYQERVPITGIENIPLTEKVEKVKSQLLNGEIKLLFDSETSSCNLVKVD